MFCYHEHDEVVLGNLGKFKEMHLKSIETTEPPAVSPKSRVSKTSKPSTPLFSPNPYSNICTTPFSCTGSFPKVLKLAPGPWALDPIAQLNIAGFISGYLIWLGRLTKLPTALLRAGLRRKLFTVS